jgi:uncharacterized protein YacL
MGGEKVIQKIARGILTILGAVLGIGIGWIINTVFGKFGILFMPDYQQAIVYFITSIGFAIMIFGMSTKIIDGILKFTSWIESRLQPVPTLNIVYGALGLIIGLVIAFLISFPLSHIKPNWLSGILITIFYLLFGYLGISTSVKRVDDLNKLGSIKRGHRDKSGNTSIKVRPKILDTSVIIDGRIFDICKTGFVEGPLIVPAFVLEELRHIADASDSLKRNRGRRGLDILNRMQKELDISVEICEKDFDDIPEVDSKLLKLAQVMEGEVLTNDYNLNKVAEFQGVPVLNINELANAVKPVVLPGEEMYVQVIKDGKEMGQGVAYLDDGTMIVVDGGKKHVGQTIGVMVTSVLQTAAGRMIFAKPKAMDKVV